MRLTPLSPTRTLLSFAVHSSKAPVGSCNLLNVFLGLMVLLVCPSVKAQNVKYAGVERTVYSFAGANLPGVAVDAAGTVYVADQTNQKVLKETLSGGIYTGSTVGPATGALTLSPVAVAVDSSLNVYIVDALGGQVIKETWTGSGYTEAAVITLLNNPGAIAVDSAQNIYLLNLDGAGWHVVLGLAADGYTTAGPLASIPPAGLGNPSGIAVDSAKNLYIADSSYGHVMKASYGSNADDYTPAILPGYGGNPVAGGDESGIAVDASGNLYIEGGTGTNDPIYLETLQLDGVTYVETEIATTLLVSPNGVAIGSNGHLYIADGGTNRVIEEIPGASAYLGAVPVGTPAAATLLFAFNGIQTGITTTVLTQGAPGLEFTDATTGTCTSNGSAFSYDPSGTNYRNGVNLFCSVNLLLTPSFPGGRFGAASLIQGGAVAATGFAQANATGPQIAYPLPAPPQTQLAGTLTSAQSVASDSAGNLYIVDQADGTVSVVSPGGAILNTITTSASSPSAVAVDGAGNVYIADTSANVIYVETLHTGSIATGTYQESILLTTTPLSIPGGVAVDGGGNVYIADTGDSRVLKETLTSTGYLETTVNTLALNAPQGIAVDGNGNVYVNDTVNSLVLKETLSGGSYTESTIVSSVNHPDAIAVDAGGNLCLADMTTGNVFMESLYGGSYHESILAPSLSPFATGVAVDGAGDVFFTNGSVNQLTLSTPTALAFSTPIQVGAQSAALPFSLQNVGNASLNFTTPGTGSNPVLDSDFSYTASGSTTCPIVPGALTTLAPGTPCVYSVEFTPTATGNLSPSMTLLKNNLNAPGASQMVMLSGTGLPGPDATSVTITATPSTIDAGQASTILVTVTDLTHNATHPTGTVVIADSAGMPGSGPLTSGTYSQSYAASFGSHSLSATYTPTDATVFNGSSSGTATLTVLVAGTDTITLAVTSGGNPATTVPGGSPVTLTATVLAASSPVTTGVVNFCDASAPRCIGRYLFGSAQLTSAGIASLKFFPRIGSYSFKAVFAGTPNALANTSAAAALTVTGTALIPNYTSTTSIAASGVAGNYSLTATVVGSGLIPLTGNVSFLDTTNSNAVLGTQAVGASSLALAFSTPSNTPPAAPGRASATGDFNGDGIPDFALAGATGVEVYLGVGDGTFTTGQILPYTLSGPVGLATGDFNGDGSLDLVLVDNQHNRVVILLGAGDGTFTAAATAPSVGSGPTKVAVADFNGDGNADLAITNSGDATVTILLGDGTGAFTAAPAQPVTGLYPAAILAGDFNEDGIADLAVANRDSNSVTILLGVGDGSFATAPAPAANSAYALATADFNHDGHLDLAVASLLGNSVTILLGDGAGSFTAGATPAAGSQPQAIVTADFDADGNADLAVMNSGDNTISVLRGDGTGAFNAVALPTVANYPVGLSTADFNGDGSPDLVTSNATVLLMQPTQTTETSTATVNSIAILGTGPHSVDASYPGDLNYAASLSTTVPLTAQPAPTAIGLVASPTSSTYGNLVVLTATLSPYTAGGVSSNGEIVTFYSGLTNVGYGTLSNGTASLALGTLPVGNDSLTVVYAGDTNLATSSSTVVPFTVSGITPTIVFHVADTTFGVAPFAVNATSNSSGAFTYDVSVAPFPPATISGNIVTVTGIGSVTLIVSQAANGNYAAANQSTTFQIAAEIPNLAFPISNQTFGAVPFAVTATSASSGAIAYAQVSGPVTVSGNTVTLTGAGLAIVSATQVANGNFAMATQNTTFSIAKEVPTLTFTVADQTFGVAPFAVAATSASTGAVTYTVVSGSATISGNTVTITGAGPVVLLASQVANGNYGAATQNATFNVATEVPTLTFNVAGQTFGAAPFTLSATSASSGAVTYAVVTGPATVSGNIVTITGAGSVTLSATQVANGNYAAATQNATFSVAVEVPTLTFTIPNQTFGAAPFAVAASSASSGAIAYAIVSGPATVSGNMVTLTGAGSVTLSATQAANGNYAAGAQNATFTIATATPILTFTVANQIFGAAPFTVVATSASTGAITYAVVSGPVTVSGSTVTLTGAGSVVLSATQAANGNYTTATQTATFNIALATPNLVFVPVPASLNTDSLPFLVGASSASTGAVSYSVVSGPATVAGATVTLTGVGAVTLSASQAAAGNYTAASTTITFTVTSGFTVAPGTGSSTTTTVVPGGAATFSLALAPGTGSTFPDPLAFSISGLPAGATATFSPATLAAGSAATTVTLTIQTSVQTAHKDPVLPLRPFAPILLGLLLPLLGAGRARRRLLRCLPLLLLTLLGGAMALTGCGTTLPSYPPAQTYTLVVTATDTTTGAHTATTLTLTVQ